MPAPSSDIKFSLHNHLDGSRSMLAILPQLWRLTHGDKKPYLFNQWSGHREQIQKWFGNPLKGDIVENIREIRGFKFLNKRKEETRMKKYHCQ